MFTFENYLFSLLVVLVPVFIYFAYIYKREYYKENSTVFGLFCMVSIILSMTYPLELETGFIFDVRTVPWLLAFLYGGLKIGLAATLVLFIYRFYIGFDEGFIIVLFSYLTAAGVVAAVLPFYRKSTVKRKLFTGTGLTLMTITFVSIGLLLSERIPQEQMVSFCPYFYAANLVTILLVTYIIESLREKEEHKMALQQTEKIKLLGEMAASVAHEIRNPLTVVKGFLHMFKQDENMTDSQKSKLDLMDSELIRAEQIISDYLSLARPEKKATEPLDLKEVIGQTVKVIEPYALLNNVSINNDVSDSLIIKGNNHDLRQVFINILKNGVEAAEGKGTVHIYAEKTAKQTVIHIKDSGRGMNEDEIKRLGTPFYTTKAQGTGLGMMVCYKILDQMRGSLKVQSEPGAGTVFSIYLPYSRGETKT